MTVPVGVIIVQGDMDAPLLVRLMSMAIKTGNVLLFRSSTGRSPLLQHIFDACKKGLEMANLPSSTVQWIDDPTKEMLYELIRSGDLIDLMILFEGDAPADFIRENSRIPLVDCTYKETHLYLHHSASLKTIEALCKICLKEWSNSPYILVDKAQAHNLLIPVIEQALDVGLSIAGCSAYASLFPEISEKTNTSSRAVAIRIVHDLDDALNIISERLPGKMDIIVSNDYDVIQRFFQAISSGLVAANICPGPDEITDSSMFVDIASPRAGFSGPLELEMLTTTKRVVSAYPVKH